MLSCDLLSRRNVILSRRSCLTDAGRLVLQIFPVVQIVKNLPTMQETWVQSLGQEDPLENGMEIHSSILAWRIQWTKEPGELQFMGSQRVGDGWATNTATLLWLSGYFCWWCRFAEYMMKIYKVFGGRRPKAREIFFFFTFHNIKILKYLYVWMVDKNKTKAQR